jgi:DNA mismatch repair protein MutL
MSQVFGSEFASNMVPVNRKGSEISIRGFAGVPTFTHKSSINQHIFINGRAVKDKQISAAIKAAYANLMTSGYFPAIILHIEINPYEVDVNVHPAKTEVRLRDPNRVKSFVISSIRSSLSNMEAQTSSQVAEVAVNIVRTSAQPVYNYEERREKIPIGFSDISFNSYQIPVGVYSGPQEIAQKSIPTPTPEPEHYTLGQAVFQIDSTYIVAESQGGLVVVDQHAAHERLVLERMKAESGSIKSQALLIPQVVELGEVLVSHLVEHSVHVEEYGISIERNGITQILVRQVSEFLAKESVGEVLKEMAEMIAEEGDS